MLQEFFEAREQLNTPQPLLLESTENWSPVDLMILPLQVHYLIVYLNHQINYAMRYSFYYHQKRLCFNNSILNQPGWKNQPLFK